MRLPSICCKMSRKITNHTAWMGSTEKIMSTPTDAPIHAPTRGMSEVRPTQAPTASA